ncbi:MAG: deoxyribodipyrimidine photolyase, partial [Acidobacteriota bacterium]
MGIPASRLRAVNDRPVDHDGDYVLYWMIAQRRSRWNFALDHAVDHCRRLGKPLLVFEALRCGYRWASDRLHRFVIDGMADNARAFDASDVRYYAYLETEEGEGRGLLEALAERAAVVVTDEYPAFFLPRMVAAAGDRFTKRLEAVDSNGLLPLTAADKVHKRAVDMRRFLQKTLPPHLGHMPSADPLSGLEGLGRAQVAAEVLERWPERGPDLAKGSLPDLNDFPIDHAVAPVEEIGGSAAAAERLDDFFEVGLPRYSEGRLDLENPSTSRLSPY